MSDEKRPDKPKPPKPRPDGIEPQDETQNEEETVPDITNPQAVAFANEKARVFAEALLTAIQTAEVFDEVYSAQAGDTLFPNTADLIADGSETDGRPRLQAQTVRALRTIAQDLATFAGTGNPTRFTRLRSMTNKGESRF